MVRAQRRQLAAAALCTLAGCVAVAYIGPKLSSASSSSSNPFSQPVASPLPVSLWIGDGYTAGVGATGATGEAIATSIALGWQTDMDAELGAGFVAPGRHARRGIKSVAARVAADAASFASNTDVVVIDAGRNDVGYPEAEIRRAVIASFKTVAKGFPASAMVVIAPYRMRSKPEDFLAIRRLLRQQARRHGWAFVDPIAEGWINRTSARLVTRDGAAPDPQGYRYIVAHLAPAIEKALVAAHEVVRKGCTRAAPCRRKVGS